MPRRAQYKPVVIGLHLNTSPSHHGDSGTGRQQQEAPDRLHPPRPRHRRGGKTGRGRGGGPSAKRSRCGHVHLSSRPKEVFRGDSGWYAPYVLVVDNRYPSRTCPRLFSTHDTHSGVSTHHRLFHPALSPTHDPFAALPTFSRTGRVLQPTSPAQTFRRVHSRPTIRLRPSTAPGLWLSGGLLLPLSRQIPQSRMDH